MLKVKAYFDKDKETKWLNRMVADGWAVNGYWPLVYRFERCQPGEYIYQIDIVESFGGVSSDYREFMRETGVEIVCVWGFWVLLRKKAAEGPFEMYTDVESRIRHYSRIRRVFKGALILEAVCFAMELMAAAGTRGAWWPIGFASLIAALMILMARELRRVSDILAELKWQTGEGAGCLRRGRVSTFLPVGMMFNAVGFIIRDWENELAGGRLVGRICVVLALVFILIGIVRTFSGRDEGA